MPYVCFSGSLCILFGLNLGSVLYCKGLYSGRSTPMLCIWIRCAPILYSNSIILVEFMVVEPCVIYKAIYNNTFLDKEFLHS